MHKSFDMVILSKSSKFSGYCVAGIELNSGRMVRLVTSDAETHGALFGRDLVMDNGREAGVLDVVRVCGASPCPGAIQTENHAIDSRTQFQFCGRMSIEEVARQYPQPKRSKVFRGDAPLIPSKAIGGIGHSLELLYVENLTVYTVVRNEKKRTRVDFELEGRPMTGFRVTDPEFYGIKDDKKVFPAAYILCSLAEDEWAKTNSYYKFVASILPVETKRDAATEKPENAGKSWKQEDEFLLLKMYESGWSVEEIAAHFGRTVGAISSRLIVYGMAGDGLAGTHVLPGASPIDNSELRERLLRGETISQLAERYGRTEKAIRTRLFYMGMGGKEPAVLPPRKNEGLEARQKVQQSQRAEQSKPREPRIMVTAFEPLGEAKTNASWEALKRIEGVEKALLPVSFRRVRSAIRIILESHPDAVICVGEAKGRATIAVERVAVNIMDAQIADNDGACPRDEAIRPGSPTAYLATLPTRRMVEDIRKAGIPAELSYSAGTHVCNSTFYVLMNAIASSGLSTLGGFIHVPSRGTSATEIARGLETAIRAVKAELSEKGRQSEPGAPLDY